MVLMVTPLIALCCKGQIQIMSHEPINLKVITKFSHYQCRYCQSLNIGEEGQLTTNEGICQLDFSNR